MSTPPRKKRPVSPTEARTIETQLAIPTNWLDRLPLRSAAKPLRTFRELPQATQALFNEMLALADSHLFSK